MAAAELLRYVPDASESVVSLLDPRRGPLERPIRSEIFGPERFALHGRSLGTTHAAEFARRGSNAFFPRLRDNIAALREAHRYIGEQAKAGHAVSPAADWLLDNFHVVEAQLREIHDGLPRRYFRDLPVLVDEPLVGLPRIYGVAWAFVAHTDSAFNEELLLRFLLPYEKERELTLGELWALPTTLRVVLIEDLRRLAERAAANTAAREVANLCSARLAAHDTAALDAILALLNRRGVGEAFLSQLAQRLHDQPAAADASTQEWLVRNAPHLAEIQVRVPAAQAADNLSTGNAITSLRGIGDADWPEVVARTSVLIQTMLASPAFAAERDDTRDETLHAVEALARRSGKSEREIAERLLALMREGAQAEEPQGDVSHAVAAYWLRGAGRSRLLSAVGIDEAPGRKARDALSRVALPIYLGSIAIFTAAIVHWFWRYGGPARTDPAWLGVVACLLLVLPASEAAVALVNRLISESTRPRRLPRLALLHGIPAEHRPLVVIPAMLTSADSGPSLAHRLQLHYLANAERDVQFALLTDWADSATESTPSDQSVLDAAAHAVDRLNALHPVIGDAPLRFLLLHRSRRHSASEGAWLGWERKRGKIEQLLAVLAHPDTASPFVDLGRLSTVGPGVAHVLTLDSDTRLPPGRLRELIGIAAHPANAPFIAADGRRVERGYAILQPHVAMPLPAPEEVTIYHWLFGGTSGVDPYSVASSEVYQDVFGEGTFTGKGLLHVRAVDAVLGGRLPESQILSHDLLEGSIARCAAVTDVNIIEETPFHADVAASRVHRWTRGDWQLLPLLLSPHGIRLGAVNRWKVLDNLRRSLVAPASLTLLVVAMATGAIAPVASLLLVALAFTTGPLIGAVAGLAPSRDDVARVHFYRQGFADLGRTLAAGAWQLGQLVQLALNAADAIGRALWRTWVSRRHLLEWQTAAAAQAASTTRLAALVRKHWSVSAVSLVLGIVLLAVGSPTPWLVVALCGYWAVAPLSIWWVSRPRPPGRADALSEADRTYLRDIARDTWRLFERCVGPTDRNLPPDNLQIVPHDLVAHRTSPTNVGLYLLSTASARAFGWIGRVEMVERLESSLATLDNLERHRGHFLNWTDTVSGVALRPRYVSTVDSGNLCVHLLAVAQACLELAREGDGGALQRGIDAARSRLLAKPTIWFATTQPSSGARCAASAATTAAAALAAGSTLAGRHELERLLAEHDLFASLQADPAAFAERLDAVEAELDPADATAAEPPSAASGSDDPIQAAARDLVATLRSALRDADVTDDVDGRLLAVAAAFQRLAREPDFEFLFHRKRRLFHIGFRVEEHQLDASFYDLLASEARSTSLWAIAKGDVPATHWAALGRPFYAVGAFAGLRSWSGSMFEYLMPTLVLDEPNGSVLHSAARAAVDEQMAYGAEHRVPWGISECAYAASDHTLAYQYGPQGVPALALRRAPADELVVAPYATLLATQVAPHRATANLDRFERLGARGRYGFIEAVDYTRARQSDDSGLARVMTFMAHHQGMSIVAVANVLLDRAPRRWGSADPRIEAVSSLLHERAPREVSQLGASPTSVAAPLGGRPGSGASQELVPGTLAVEPTHLLANGRYAVALRGNGAGTSRWGSFDIGRSRDDALRDSHGIFFYLRWDRQPQPVSLTQHPAPDRAADYRTSFHPDRAVHTAAWPEFETSLTVWVSPEDDIEFRRVVVHNRSDRALDLELMTAFEATLADPRADESHPAFSNLFVSAEWAARDQAIVLHRKARLAGDKEVWAAHFLADADPPVVELKLQVDRRRWHGRNRLASHPIAEFDVPPAASVDGAASRLETGLDPVSALSTRLRLPPLGRCELTFCVAAAGDRGTLDAVVDKYRQPSHVERASMMSATLAGIRLREMELGGELAAIRTLTTLLSVSLTRVHAREAQQAQVCDRRLLWRFGISGDRPIVLVNAGVAQGGGLLRTLGQALRLWSWGGVACDLVVVNHEPVSYLQELNRRIVALKEEHAAARAAQPGTAETAFHLLQATDLQADETTTLRALARVRLNADGRPLSRHVQELCDHHDASLEDRQSVSTTALPARMGANAQTRASRGDFAPGGEFRFAVAALARPPRPWINVLANPSFGAQLSEGGGGYSWALNSRLNMLTPWSNDPVGDPPGEWFVLQDTKSMRAWSLLPSASGDDEAEYRVAHGQGYSVVSHRHQSIEVQATWCVDAELAAKQVRVRLINRGHRSASLRIVGVAEWILGQNRSDRATTITAMASHRSIAAEPSSQSDPADAGEQRMTTLYATQRDRSAGFGGGTAFFGLAGDAEELADWTCDRRECFDSRGRFVIPDQYGQTAGGGLDPCAALSTRFVLRAGETADRVFILGWAPSPEGARALAERAATRTSAIKRLQDVRQRWDDLLGATVVKTPDPLFDAMVNRWLPYQAVACRLWAKAGFYQAGGAYGYRDQLQDTLSLAWSRPGMLRAQILLSASRQFAEGDVQHWWHAPTGAGVRTRFSDDLLWLPYATAHYVETSGEGGLLDEPVPFLEGIAVPDGAEDAYYAPEVSDERASVYEHCARAIDRSLATGVHGLPLMGTGDWNDGMNRVGDEGRGESVWLAWFAIDIVSRFAPLADRRGDAARASRWRAGAAGWRTALERDGWDGAWYRRAFFDDGTPLGTSAATECRIDLIAQAWAVLSGGAPDARARTALASADERLVEPASGLVRLLDPPLVHHEPSAGYIQAYPPGVRENGGQYAHAAVWALMAQAALGNGDVAYRYFTAISPAHRSRHPIFGAAYEIEPYVVAGDTYSAPPYVGRGGWSWYTGSAGWLARAAIESMFGFSFRGDDVSFSPCLPNDWSEAEITLSRGGRTLRLVLTRDLPINPATDDGTAIAWQTIVERGQTIVWSTLPAVSTVVMRLGAANDGVA